REIHTWSKCEHRYVLKLFGLVQFRGHIGMVSPWVTRGSLNNYLMDNPSVNRPRLSMQVADGLAYLHSCGVVSKLFIHGDLKGANVLLSDSNDPLLTDFGNAVLHERTLQFTYSTAKTNLSPRWTASRPFPYNRKMLSGQQAPELFRGEGSFSVGADVFALGMVRTRYLIGTRAYLCQSFYTRQY
ncbi:kinase-like protein, partial [Ceratobasidium sp. AG-I]